MPKSGGDLDNDKPPPVFGYVDGKKMNFHLKITFASTFLLKIEVKAFQALAGDLNHQIV